ncbi:MAG: PIG-L family deacetylase, partial [Cyclobacteriaceae bacterium]|nr:PIG-L family deacetylase [Cyclobacteriaceae bacterium]
MERRSFLSKSLALGLVPSSFETSQKINNTEEIVVEKYQSGQPHKGKVLAAIQPHSDDIPIFAGGTVAKLIREGYTGYLIRTSNDDHAGRGATEGEVIHNNEKDNAEVAKTLGLSKVYNLGYRNHRMDNISIQELRGRLIFLFRMLKVDTIISYDPWGHYEENPDHYITASAVESARWMAG